ncbi:MAG: hypothetical protein WCG21_14810 [Eubacteriales bacterium]
MRKEQLYNQYTVEVLSDKDRIEAAANWFHQKWNVPLQMGYLWDD